MSKNMAYRIASSSSISSTATVSNRKYLLYLEAGISVIYMSKQLLRSGFFHMHCAAI
jgi:hypothetical protein